MVGNKKAAYAYGLAALFAAIVAVAVGAAVFMFGGNFSAAAETVLYDEAADFTFSYDDATGAATVTGLADNSDGMAHEWGRITIPAAVEKDGKTYAVTKIGAWAFSLPYNGGILSITMPDTITDIEEGALNWCSNLRSVVLSQNLQTIGNQAISWCGGLRTLAIPASVTKIGAQAFWGSGLQQVVIPNPSVEIGAKAFAECHKLLRVTLGTAGASGTPTIAATGGTTDIFYNAYALKEIYDHTGALSDKTLRIAHNGTSTLGYTDDVYGGTYGGVLYTGENIDAESRLHTITVPSYDGNRNETFTFHIDNGAYTLAAYGNTGAKPYTVNLFKTLNAEDTRNLTVGGVRVSDILAAGFEIGPYAFKGNYYFDKFELSGVVTKMNIGAFSECSVAEVSLASENQRLTEIGPKAFEYCWDLQRVEIPDGIRKVGSRAFAYCSNLAGVVFPVSLTEFGTDYINSEGPGQFQNVEDNNPALRSVTLPTTTALVPEMFAGNINLTTVNFVRPQTGAEEKLTVLPQNIFAQTAVEAIELPACVETVESNAFRNCEKLKYIGFTAETLTLENDGNGGGGALQYCSALETVSFAGVKHLALQKGTFNSSSTVALNTVLDTVFLPDDLSGIDNWIGEIKTVAAVCKNAALKIVAGGKGVYDAAAAQVADTTQKEKLYYQTDIAFEVYVEGNAQALASVKQTKLAKPSGADIRYTLSNRRVGNVDMPYWTIDEGYALPSRVGQYAVDPADWGVDVTAYLVSADNVAIKQTIERIKVEKPDDATAVYGDISDDWSGVIDGTDVFADAPYTFVSADFGGQTGLVGADPNGYLVTVELKENYAWSDGTAGNRSTFKLFVEKRRVTLDWKVDGGRSQPVSDGIYETTYNGNHHTVTATSADEVWLRDMGAAYAYSILDSTLSAKLAQGDQWIDVATTRNAGVYRIAALGDVVKDNYEFINDSVVLRVTAQAVDLNDYDVLHWSLSWTGVTQNSAYLRTGELYIYNEDDAEIPYYGMKRDENGQPVSGGRRQYVEQSYARYRADASQNPIDMTVLIRDGDAETAPYTVAYDGDASYRNTAKEVGVYTAYATLTAKNNYSFVTGLGADARARGLTITVSDDGKTAVVTKVWYIVRIDNGMLDVTSADGNAVEYSIADWKFGESVTVSAPRLEHGDEDGDAYTENGMIRFTLTRNGANIGNAFTREDFDYYINASMPAGDYVLQCDISDVVLGAHTHWWGGADASHESADDVLYRGFTRFLRFSVSPANIALTLTAGANGYAAYEWSFDLAHVETMFDDFADALDGKTATVSVVRTGYWSTNAAAALYGDYTVSYNLARMHDDAYYGANDGELRGFINKPDTYIVYFNISAPNHADLTPMDEGRYGYYLTVTAYMGNIAAPTVTDAGLTYTGSKALPTIEESELYEIVWSADDEYIAGGTHKVAFKLYDGTHYRWADSNTDTVEVSFTIGKASNSWLRDPNIVDWQFETFDTDINRIRAVPRYIDGGRKVLFTVTKADGTAIDGLQRFTVNDDGTVDDKALRDALNGLRFGAYKLDVLVEGTDNYLPLSASIDFRIDKAMNAWADGDDDLAIPNWIVGKYNADEHPIVVNAAHGAVNIVITDLDGNEYYNSTTGVNKLGECAVGKYLLKAWVDETEDFAALAERTFTFEVLEKVGMPWWGTLLITLGALLVAAAILFVLWKKGVFQILTGKIVLAIRTRASVDATIASVRAAKKMEEGRRSVEEAKRRERAEERKAAAEAERAKPAEERAATLEQRAQAEADKAEKIRARSEALKARAERLREKAAPTAEQEAAATDTETETEE